MRGNRAWLRNPGSLAKSYRAIIDSTLRPLAENIVANLIVRDIDESLVRALKQRAARYGRSAEAEHREILAPKDSLSRLTVLSTGIDR